MRSTRDLIWTEVPVRITARAPAMSEAITPCVEGWPGAGRSCEPAARAEQWPDGEPLPVRRTGGLVLAVIADEPLTAIGASANSWAGLIAAGAVVLVLLPHLRSITAGSPFAPGNARRLVTAAGVAVAGWAASTILPLLVAPRLIQAAVATPRSDGTGSYALPEGWLGPDVQLTWWPLVAVLLLAVLAEASRRGARLARETDGLV